MRGASRHSPAGLRLGTSPTIDLPMPNFAVARLQRSIANWIISAAPPGETPIWGEELSRQRLSYLEALSLMALVTVASFAISRHLTPIDVVMFYVLAVVIAAVRWGRGPATCSAVAGAFAFDFFVIPPLMNFAITDIGYLITMVSMLAVALIVSALVAEVREQAETARTNAAYVEAVYAIAQALAETGSQDQIVKVFARHVVETFHWPVLLALPVRGGLATQFRSPEFAYDDAEWAAAVWAYEVGQPAGRGTERFPEVRGHYLPLRTAWGIKGVLAAQVGEAVHPRLAARQYRVLEAFATRAALALGRAELEQKAHEAQLLEETDRLQKALLNSISHNLRTPLATVTGTLRSLLEDTAILDESTRQEMLINAEEQATRLNRLVGNLLDMSRLEAGAVRVKPEPCDIQDVVGAALEQLGEAARCRPIRLRLPAHPLLVNLDFVLVTQVLVNLVDNALKYSADDRPIEIQVRETDGQAEVEVIDHGEGIPQEHLEKAFERFYRCGRSDGGTGAGLGLSICKGFVEAHGGRIRVRRGAEGGTTVAFTIPMTADAERHSESEDERTRVTSTRG